jgi:5-methylcytosine-specific restriction protein A
MLVSKGEVRISPDTFGSRRSSFIGAVVSSLPSVETSSSPSLVRLSPETPLRDSLVRACQLTGEDRNSARVSREDPLYGVVVKQLPELLAAAAGDAQSYTTIGRVGQTDWSETPLAAIFDRMVTDSAQRGHYLVFLFHRHGSGVFVSLNQGITAVRETGGNLAPRLRREARRYQENLPSAALIDLNIEEIDLAATTSRSKGYSAGNIAALWLPIDEMPHDTVLVGHLWRFLALYSQSVAAENVARVALEGGSAGVASNLVEARRFGWHWRAEGRNSLVARIAKELQGYQCQGCGRDFVAEFGEVGKRCVEAHHLTPFSKLDSRPRNLDPQADFAVVCSNCHRLLHSRPEPLSMEQLAELLARNG